MESRHPQLLSNASASTPYYIRLRCKNLSATKLLSPEGKWMGGPQMGIARRLGACSESLDQTQVQTGATALGPAGGGLDGTYRHSCFPRTTCLGAPQAVSTTSTRMSALSLLHLLGCLRHAESCHASCIGMQMEPMHCAKACTHLRACLPVCQACGLPRSCTLARKLTCCTSPPCAHALSPTPNKGKNYPGRVCSE